MSQSGSENNITDLFYKSTLKDFDFKIGSMEINLPESINDCNLELPMDRIDPEKSYDPERDLLKETPIYIRHQFIRKVFFIVMLQILSTLAFTAVAYFVPVINEFLIQYPYVSVGSASLYCLMIITFIIFPNLLQSQACCICFLASETILLSVVAATATCFYELKEISIALGVTVAVFATLTVLSFQIKFDLTRWFGFTVLLSVIIVIFAALVLIIDFKPLYLAFTITSTLATCLYILVDVQFIAGGKKKYTFSVDEYILAASTLYCDFITLFINILHFFRF